MPIELEGPGYLLKGSLEILGRAVIARHLQEGILVFGHIRVVVIAKRLVAGDPGKGAQDPLILPKAARSVPGKPGKLENARDHLAEARGVIGLEHAFELLGRAWIARLAFQRGEAGEGRNS